MPVTLVLTRNPLREFKYGGCSGRWGELVAIKGPRIFSVNFFMGFGNNLFSNGDSAGMVSTEYGAMNFQSSGEGVGEVKRFRTIERFRADHGGKGYYVQLHPRPNPYTVTFETGNSAVKHLHNKKHDGRCFRVHGGKTAAEQGILIHEAPNVSWVIGCIGPRPLNATALNYPNEVGNPSYNAMDELFNFVDGGRADLFVLDW